MAASTIAQEEQPISRTYQYRKIMKPMLERKRRARINRCLDELKELLVGALQAEGESVSRLEKADVLELTVRHLHKLRRSQQLSESSAGDKFRQGFLHCANEVSRYISTAVSAANGPSLDISVSTRLVSHLDTCIRSIESQLQPQFLPHPQGIPPPPPTMQSPRGSQLSPYPVPVPPVGVVPMMSPPVPIPHSSSSSSHHGANGGSLNILTSYTPPSSPASSSSSSGQKVYYIAPSSSVSSTGSLSPIPIPPAHYQSSSPPTHYVPQSATSPLDLSNNMIWRPF